MRKKLLLTAIFALAGSSFAQEKELTLKISQPLELYGGVSAGYFYTTNEGNDSAQDAFQVTNAIIGLKGEVGEAIKMGFDLAVGGSLWATVFDGGQGTISSQSVDSNGDTDGLGILWGYVSLKPISKLSIDAGIITTNIGYEIADTYSNPNVTFGAVWFGQPFIYPGARVNFDLTDAISLYAEYNKEYGGDNFAVGSLGEIAGISYGLTYFDYNDTTSGTNKNLIDVVLGYSIGNIDVGLNADYQWLDDSAKVSGQDDSAYGVALYVTPNFGNLSVPVRIEYFDEGTSGIYFTPDFNGDGTPDAFADNGYTFTVTPTFKPTENTFIRGEVSYVSAKNRVFKNGQKKDKTTLSVELGFTF